MFLQNPEGYWDPSPSLALSLLAQRIQREDVAHLQRGKRQAWKIAVATVTTDETIDEAGVIEGVSADEGKLCPLTGLDHSAIEWSMPERLRTVASTYADSDKPMPALRIWVRLLQLPTHAPSSSDFAPLTASAVLPPAPLPASVGLGDAARMRILTAATPLPRHPSTAALPQTTILISTLLIQMDESWLLKTDEEDGFDETVVDRAMFWLAQMARGGDLSRACPTIGLTATLGPTPRRNSRVQPACARDAGDRRRCLNPGRRPRCSAVRDVRRAYPPEGRSPAGGSVATRHVGDAPRAPCPPSMLQQLSNLLFRSHLCSNEQ